MKEFIKKLSYFLRNSGEQDSADKVDNLSTYDEDWHEEVVNELGSEPISQEEYENQFAVDLVKELENQKKYYRSRPYEKHNIEDADFLRNFDTLNYSKGFKQYPAILENHNFKLIMGGEKFPYIGSGVYGKVFRGVYNGKPAVAKIILHDGHKEVAIWNKILEAKKSLPADMQKHIPKVYVSEDGSISSESGQGTPYTFDYGIVIMEELYPLPTDIDMLMNRWSDIEKNNYKFVFNDEDFLFKLSNHLNYYLKNTIELRSRLTNLNQHIILKALLSIKKLKNHNSKSIAAKVSNAIIEDLGLEESSREFYNFKENLKVYTNQFIRNTIEPSGFPTEIGDTLGKDKSLFWEEAPETNSLLKTLSKLSRDFGIDYEDLHSNNIMTDKDGNLKIIDVGLFKLYKNEEE